MTVKELINQLKKYPESAIVAGSPKIFSKEREPLTDNDWFWNESSQEYEVRPYLIIKSDLES